MAAVGSAIPVNRQGGLDDLISSSLNHCFSGIQSCRDTIHLFNEHILTKLLQFLGLLRHPSRELASFGANLRNCFLDILGCPVA
jgi:hypothetical protein